MALIQMKPTSPGQRHVVRVVTPGLHKGAPHAPLLEKKSHSGGRNNNGHMTTRHKGGGHKQHYRLVDFKRNKDGIPAKVERIEYDPNRSAHIALVLFADGERIATAQIQEGGASQVGLVAPGGVRISIPKGSEPHVSLSLRYEGPLQAPVAKGEEVAELVISIAGMPENRVPLVAGEEVLEATLVQRVFNAFRSWVT